VQTKAIFFLTLQLKNNDVCEYFKTNSSTSLYDLFQSDFMQLKESEAKAFLGMQHQFCSF
jgi:hypothetical protein